MEHQWWILGWGTALVVVALVAALLLVSIFLVRRIIGQAGDIIAALDGARTNTEPLYDIANTNHALIRIARGLGPVPEDARSKEQAQ